MQSRVVERENVRMVRAHSNSGYPLRLDMRNDFFSKEQCCTARLHGEGGSPSLGVSRSRGDVELRDVGTAGVGWTL